MHEILLARSKAAEVDPLINQVVVLSHFNSQKENGDFLDRKLHRIIPYNGARLNSNDPPKFGYGSVEFNGGYLDIPGTDLELPGDFTIEAWVYFRDFDYNTNTAILGHSAYASAGNGNFLLRTSYGPTEIHWASYDGAFNSGNSHEAILMGKVAGGIPTYTWHHVAVCRKDGTVGLFFNGKLIGTVVDNKVLNVGSEYAFRIGGGLLYCRSLSGGMDELRITKFARYLTDFKVSLTGFPDS